MTEELKLNRPWLVAVWPGMGQVAMSAGFYLMSEMGMHLMAEFQAQDLFEVEEVEVKEGLIRAAHLPRSRLYVWNDPREQHDIIVFIGEAQPAQGKQAFCKALIEFVEKLNVERVFTFAAMATAMRPEQPSRVFGAAADAESLDELRLFDLEILQEGKIGGLNGVLLGVAAEKGLHGTCLLGEIPAVFSQIPFPKASLAVLRVFTQLAGLEIDFSELEQHAAGVDERLSDVYEQIQDQVIQMPTEDPEESYELPPREEEPKLKPEDQELIERLFTQAAENRSKAYELKRELDRLEVFDEYEDRFLDLFKKSD